MGLPIMTSWRKLPRSLVLLLTPLFFASMPGCAGPEQEMDTAETSREHARVIAEEVMEAMGGRDAWNATRYLRFSFFGFRTHYWDKDTGRYRVSWTDRESGQSHVVLMNLDTGEGRAFTDGTEITDAEERNRFLERARGAWINDTYWLLMPYKLQDPGVDLAYAGEEVVDGIFYDTLHLRFDDVGNTPGDEYWAYINRETRLMDRWVYLLQLREGQDERSRGEWKWNNWSKYGDILLSAERERMDGQKRSHEDVAVYEHVDDLVFASPEPVSPAMVRERSESGDATATDASDGSVDSQPTTQPAVRSE